MRFKKWFISPSGKDLESKDPRKSFAPVAGKYLTSAIHARPDSLRALAARIGTVQGTIADIGTGAGHLAYALSEVCDRVTAVDLTPEMLAIVAAEATKRGIENIETLLADAVSMPFETESLAGVATRLAAHHFADPAAFVAECKRVTRPGGWLLIVDTVGPEDPKTQQAVDQFECKRDPSHVHDLAVSEWIKLVESFGYSIDWVDAERKTLELEEWMDRMEVPELIREELREDWAAADGLFREYLNPQPGPPKTFDLWEMALFARLPDPLDA